MTPPPFRERLRARWRLAGTFVKTPSCHVVEVLGTSSLDFIVIDAEHAPFDRAAIDVCVLAARAAGIDALVRVPDTADATLLNALDVGAAGIVVPHASDPAAVRHVLGGTRYRQGRRGFSNSARAGGYGTRTMAQLLLVDDSATAVVCQIEDRDGVECIEALAAIDEVDCFFIGRADLAVSYGADRIDAPEVADAVARICTACTQAGKAIGIFLADIREAEAFARAGVTLFVVGSDQSMLRAHADGVAATLSALRGSPPQQDQEKKW